MDTSSRYVKFRIGFFVFTAVGLVLYLAAFATVRWASHTNREEGLWQIGYIHEGKEEFSLWPDHLKTGQLQVAQAFGSIGLAFYTLFAVSSALSIFWTNKWKFARAIKFSAVVFSTVAATSVIGCLVIYKSDRESKAATLTTSWFIALVSAVMAVIAAPFYFIDALRTIAPKEDKSKKFINNIPPVPTFENMHPPSIALEKSLRPVRDPFSKQENQKHAGNSTRPPLLNELRRYRTSSLHPPPKPVEKKPVITVYEIESLPLPPTLTKLDLYEKDEIEGHPSPAPPLVMPDEHSVDPGNSEHDVDRSDESPNPDSEHNGDNEHSVFKFHKTKTIQKHGKTFLKIQNNTDTEKLPPVMMIMPGNDEQTTEQERKRQKLSIQERLRLEEEEARKNYEVYFDESTIETVTLDAKPSEPKKQNTKPKLKLNKSQKQSIKRQEVRKSEIKEAYEDNPGKEKAEKSKTKKNKKSKKKSSKKLKKGSTKVEILNDKNSVESTDENSSDDESGADLDTGSGGASGDTVSETFSHQDALTIHNYE